MTTFATPALFIVGVIVVALVLFVVIFRAMWRVAEPNEALVISGLHHRSHEETGESLGFKIVTGRGTLALYHALEGIPMLDAAPFARVEL